MLCKFACSFWQFKCKFYIATRFASVEIQQKMNKYSIQSCTHWVQKKPKWNKWIIWCFAYILYIKCTFNTRNFVFRSNAFNYALWAPYRALSICWKCKKLAASITQLLTACICDQHRKKRLNWMLWYVSVSKLNTEINTQKRETNKPNVYIRFG